MSAAGASATPQSTAWRGPLALLVVPILAVGLFARVYYTPDEPREASLSVAMAHQSQLAVPELGGRYFLEKPPLAYWLSAAAVRAFGERPWVVRLPGLLYGLITVGALGALAARAAGAVGALLGGAVAATALLLYQVEIWLATDAPLLAGVAVALYGIYRGWTAPERRDRYIGYAWLQAGLILAFFAKNLAGWMVPAMAFLTLVVWERRWRELLRFELWAATPVTLIAIGLWVAAVARLPDGDTALRVFFWNNLIGRAVPVASEAQFAYATGHLNAPGKYLLELPVYLLPWTPLAVAALWRAPPAARGGEPSGTAWRLALGVIVPSSLLLSLAATARGVYYAPTALGFAILVALWATRPAPWRALDRVAVISTALCVALLALLIAGLDGLAACAPAFLSPTRLALGALGGAAAAIALVGAWLGWRRSQSLANRVESRWPALKPLAVATALSLSVAVVPVYVLINGWFDLQQPAVALRAAAGGRPLLLLYPDETTEAMVHLYLKDATVVGVVRETDPGARAVAAERLAAWPAVAVLYLVPDRPRWDVSRWRAFLGYAAAARAAEAVRLPAGLPPLAVECTVTRAGGRSIALLSAAPAGALADTQARGAQACAAHEEGRT